MKILIVLLRKAGGVGRANTEIAKALRKKGHEVDLLSREDDLQKYSFASGIFPIRKKSKELMKQKNYDIIYTQDFSCGLSILFPYPLFIRKHYYCSIGIKHSGLLKYLQLLVGRIMGGKTVVIFDTNKKRFPKANLVYRGVDPEMFKPLKQKKRHLGYMNKFSELVPAERYEKIAKQMKMQTIVAGKKQKKKIKRTFSEEDSHNFNKFTDEEMNEFYNKCQVFINLATPDAGFNLSWLEAMAAGVPIIIGDNNGAGPMLPFDKILNEKNMEKEIVQIIKNPKKVDYRKWIIENGLTWEATADKLIDIFDRKI